MSKPLVLTVAACVLLAGCHKEPAKREPGSWTQKVTVTKLTGKDVKPGQQAMLQQMFDAMGKVSVCLTPEAAAREDMANKLENTGGGKECSFERKTFSGEKVDFAGTCTDAGTGKKVHIAANGTSGTSAQDITMTVQPLGADGKPEGEMTMRLQSTRGGACKPGDITPPAPPAGPAPAPAPTR